MFFRHTKKSKWTPSDNFFSPKNVNFHFSQRTQTHKKTFFNRQPKLLLIIIHFFQLVVTKVFLRLNRVRAISFSSSSSDTKSQEAPSKKSFIMKQSFLLIFFGLGFNKFPFYWRSCQKTVLALIWPTRLRIGVINRASWELRRLWPLYLIR